MEISEKAFQIWSENMSLCKNYLMYFEWTPSSNSTIFGLELLFDFAHYKHISQAIHSIDPNNAPINRHLIIAQKQEKAEEEKNIW